MKKHIHKKQIKTIIVSLLIIVFVSGLAIFVCNKTADYIRIIVVEEQKREFVKLEKIITHTEKNLQDLTYKLNDIEESRVWYLSDEMSDEVLLNLQYLENDSLKIENFLTQYHNDISVHLNGSKDPVIDEKIDSLWSTHRSIDRLVRTVEEIAFTDRIYLYSINTAKSNIGSILDEFEQMRQITTVE